MLYPHPKRRFGLTFAQNVLGAARDHLFGDFGMTGRKVVIIVLALALIAAMAAPALMATPRPASAAPMAASPTAKPVVQSNIVSALQSRSDLSTFAGDINKVGLANTLNSGGPYTIFAPTNDAFGKLPSVKASVVNQDNANLGYTLKYHVVNGKYTEAQLKSLNYLMTTNDRAVPVSMAGNNIMVDGARITGPGIDLGNSIIYPVDSVMVPPMLTA